MKATKGKVLSNKELLESKVLVEANRMFFHALGLHLHFNEDAELVISEESPTIHYGGFTDADRKGIHKLQEKARQIAKIRRDRLGYHYQPIQSEDARSISRNISKIEVQLHKTYEDIERLERKLRRPVRDDFIDRQDRKNAEEALQIAKSEEKRLVSLLETLRSG